MFHQVFLLLFHLRDLCFVFLFGATMWDSETDNALTFFWS